MYRRRVLHSGCGRPRVGFASSLLLILSAGLLVISSSYRATILRSYSDVAHQELGADWQLTKYSGAVHSFTNPDSGNDVSKGMAYNAAADKRSWRAMQDLFSEVFGAGAAKR